MAILNSALAHSLADSQPDDSIQHANAALSYAKQIPTKTYSHYPYLIYGLLIAASVCFGTPCAILLTLCLDNGPCREYTVRRRSSEALTTKCLWVPQQSLLSL